MRCSTLALFSGYCWDASSGHSYQWAKRSIEQFCGVKFLAYSINISSCYMFFLYNCTLPAFISHEANCFFSFFAVEKQLLILLLRDVCIFTHFNVKLCNLSIQSFYKAIYVIALAIIHLWNGSLQHTCICSHLSNISRSS